MLIFRKKVDYTFPDYCRKQIAMYECIKEAETDLRSKSVYDGVIARYDLMLNEYAAYQHDLEFMKNCDGGNWKR